MYAALIIQYSIIEFDKIGPINVMNIKGPLEENKPTLCQQYFSDSSKKR